MLRPTRQHEWRASHTQNSLKVPNNQFISSLVADECGINIVDCHFVLSAVPCEISQSRDDLVFDVRGLCGLLRAKMKANRATLHIDNGMVPIFSSQRRRHTENISCFDLTKNSLEGKR